MQLQDKISSNFIFFIFFSKNLLLNQLIFSSFFDDLKTQKYYWFIDFCYKINITNFAFKFFVPTHLESILDYNHGNSRGEYTSLPYGYGYFSTFLYKMNAFEFIEMETDEILKSGNITFFRKSPYDLFVLINSSKFSYYLGFLFTACILVFLKAKVFLFIFIDSFFSFFLKSKSYFTEKLMFIFFFKIFVFSSKHQLYSFLNFLLSAFFEIFFFIFENFFRRLREIHFFFTFHEVRFLYAFPFLPLLPFYRTPVQEQILHFFLRPPVVGDPFLAFRRFHIFDAYLRGLKHIFKQELLGQVSKIIEKKKLVSR